MSKEERETKKKKDIESFILEDGKVDWRRWDSLVGREMSYNEELRDSVINYLIELGILSLEPEGNYKVTDGSLNLSPEISICQTYFTDRERARNYAQALYSGARYPVRIEKISEVEELPRS